MGVRNDLPSLFIGSSSEGLKVAEYLQVALEDHCEVTIWSQGVIGLGQSPLDSLVAACKHSDFAVFIFTPSDMLTKHGSVTLAPRDNVLFELGLFMGWLGRSRTFIVYCGDEKIDLPSDLVGVAKATFPKREDGNIEAAINPAAVKIKNAIGKIRNSDNPQANLQNMLREFVEHNNLVNELKEAHHMLQELAIPLDTLATGFKTLPDWREKPPTTGAIEGVRISWRAVLRKFNVIEYFAPSMKSLEARSFFNLLTQIKNDFEATLEDSKPVRLYDLSLQLYDQCQDKLEIIDKLMLKQFDQTDRIIKQISRSIGDDST